MYFFFNRVPAGLELGFRSGRVLPEAQIRSQVGSGNTFLGSGFGYTPNLE